MRASPPLPRLVFAQAFIAAHDVPWYGTSLWSAGVSHPGCVPSASLAHPQPPGHWVGGLDQWTGSLDARDALVLCQHHSATAKTQAGCQGGSGCTCRVWQCVGSCGDIDLPPSPKGTLGFLCFIFFTLRAGTIAFSKMRVKMSALKVRVPTLYNS